LDEGIAGIGGAVDRAGSGHRIPFSCRKRAYFRLNAG
jgi:hypothetical protein